MNLTVNKQEVVVIMGPSGSGKSTFIRTFNGLESYQKGRIIIDGITVSHNLKNIEVIRQEVGMVFQQFNLFPHLTVLDNVTVVEGQDSNVTLTVTVDNPNPQPISFNYTTGPIDAGGDAVMQDVQENLKSPSIADVVGNVLTMRSASSVDFFMSPCSSMADDESDAESATSLFGLAFSDDDERDQDSLCMSSSGSSVGDESDGDSATSLFGLVFLDENELDEDSLFTSPGSSVDEEVEVDAITSPVSNVEEIVTPSVLFRTDSDSIRENNSEIGSFEDVGVYAFIMADMEENRDRWISLGCV